MQKRNQNCSRRSSPGLVSLQSLPAFFILQVEDHTLPKDGFQTLLFILLLVPEIWLVQVWNSFSLINIVEKVKNVRNKSQNF